MNVGSEEFVQIFVHHEIPAISNIATIMLSIADKEVVLQEMQSKLQKEQEQELTNVTSGDEIRVLSTKLVRIWL